MNWIAGGTLAGILAVTSVAFRFLTRDGAIGAFVMGWLVFSLGGLPFSVPILLFFLSSSLLSRIAAPSGQNKTANRFQKAGGRDLKQVLANGTAATVLLIIWSVSPEPIWVSLYLTALAAATSDTWATEIGMLSNAAPRSIWSFQKVEKGTSGGVTLAGMIAAAAGAFVIAVCGWVIFPDTFTETWRTVAVITLSGVVAQTADSLLGATLQAQYCCPRCHRYTEHKRHCGDVTELQSGLALLDNDLVNFFSIGWGVLLAGLLQQL